MINTNNNLIKLTTTGMLSALTCVATMVIRIPTFATNGYINIGDVIVLISSWLLLNPYGAIAAGLGSALADLLAGYTHYVLGTFVIKFFMAFTSSIIISSFSKKSGKTTLISYLFSAIIAEMIMVIGYFIYESIFLGYGIAAAGSIMSNCIQGASCLIIGVILINALSGSIHLIKQYTIK